MSLFEKPIPLAVGALALAGIAYFFFGRKKSGSGKVALARKFQPFKLVERSNVTHDTIKLRFALPSPDMLLGLPTGKHIKLKFTDAKTGEVVAKPYTPTSGSQDKGFFELMVKVYPGITDRKGVAHPPGKMGTYLNTMALGDSIMVAGPIGKIEYVPGVINNKMDGKIVAQKVQKIGMLAGGTGITPMLQVINEIARNNKDRTEVSLIFANKTEQDILCRAEIEAIAETMTNFNVFLSIDDVHGFVTPDVIKKHLPGPGPDTAVFICGPPIMVKIMSGHLSALEYPEETIYCF
jgi:cytochrome-b5 reductase